MKRYILFLLIVLSGNFAGFNFADVHALDSDQIDLYKDLTEKRCLDIKNLINEFDNSKNKKDVKYIEEAYKVELEALISLENAVSCMNPESNCKGLFENEKTSVYKINKECVVPENGEALIHSASEFQKSAKLFEQSRELYLGASHLPLEAEQFKENGERDEKRSLDIIMSNNIITRAGNGFLYSTQNRLRDIFTGSLIRKVNAALGTLAILFLFILGAKFIMARGDTERLSDLKGQFAWIVLGLLVISIAEYVGFEIFNPESNILEGQSEANFSSKVREIVRYLEYIAAGLMLINALLSAYGLIMAGEEDESISREKQFLKSFLLGTVFILLAEVIVRVLTFRDGLEVSAGIAIKEIAGLINFSLSFIGIAAVAMLVMSGLYYVISFGDEDQMGRAKKMVISSVVGVIISFSAYTLIRFLIV